MDLVILHTNDTHGQLTSVSDLEGRTLGGYARRASYIQQQREKHPNLLLLDAGDLYQGSRYWHAFKGEADIELMNYLGYDAAALGNHDTDGGMSVLAKRIQQAKFPTLCANMRFPEGHDLADLWQPYTLFQVGEARIGVFSMLTDAMELYPEPFREGVTVEPYIETARRMVPLLRQQADMVILLSHLGHTDDIRLAENVTGIDLIIGGHTHTGLWDIHSVNGTPMVRAIVGGPVVGRVVVKIMPGQRPRIVDYRLVELTDRFPDDPQIGAILARWDAQLPPERLIGQLASPIDTRGQIKNFGESAAGNLYVDALLAYLEDEVDLALVHMGTIRGERIFPAGGFTNHDLAEYHPFDNPPMLMDLTAPELKFMLERGLHEFPAGRGLFLSVAGLELDVDLSRQPQVIDRNHARVRIPGERVVAARFRGAAVDFADRSRVFRVATDGYIGRGGAGFFVAKTAANLQQLALGGNAIIEWYFRTNGALAPQVEGRIRMMNGHVS